MADDSAPGPGHFLPGGTGDAPGDAGTGPSQPIGRPLSLGKPRPVQSEVDPSLKKAVPLRTEYSGTEYGGPPPAPLPGAPVVPLQGSRQAGGARRTGWHSPSTRAASQFAAGHTEVKPSRRMSTPAIAGLGVLLLALLVGGGITSLKLADSYDGSVQNPLAKPSVHESQEPLPAPPQATVTVTVKPVPDDVRVKQNKLYTVGKVPSVRCTEPAIKLTGQSAMLRYYQALLPCLNNAWAPLVRKAGYPFRAPRLTLLSKQTSSTCTGETTSAYYCPADESINMDWQEDLKTYRRNPLAARTWMMNTLAHEYGHHVQYLTNISISSQSREGWAKTQAAKLEESRRLELQATCLGAAFLGANKESLGFSGAKLDSWRSSIQHSGDEYSPKKLRDHGARKNQWPWAGPAFSSANPASCNTYTAAAARVS
ncbi:putative neutral zinc metallopeptidase [Kribbella voronezhensis]|uniref:Putative neutral zinc metallopeptidase n=1 Tax=Kribbella voronezhensis TaxID=2512212 RepID=A0A4R7T9W6_9ACTN|nr:neutral zinc metallopeptidase [Kribbella voronezhensis]TDU88790.1 putative neutral zinc metallopeptidase [Kribbella voronezhensis]